MVTYSNNIIFFFTYAVTIRLVTLKYFLIINNINGASTEKNQADYHNDFNRRATLLQ